MNSSCSLSIKIKKPTQPKNHIFPIESISHKAPPSFYSSPILTVKTIPPQKNISSKKPISNIRSNSHKKPIQNILLDSTIKPNSPKMNIF